MAKKQTQKEASIEPTPAEVKLVMKYRAEGMPWLAIMEKMGKPRQFVLKVRPVMKRIDPTSIAPSYDRHPKKSVKTAAKPVPKKRTRSKVVAS